MMIEFPDMDLPDVPPGTGGENGRSGYAGGGMMGGVWHTTVDQWVENVSGDAWTGYQGGFEARNIAAQVFLDTEGRWFYKLNVQTTSECFGFATATDAKVAAMNALVDLAARMGAS